MVRRSSRAVGKSKWPCGVCRFQCNDDAVLCEDCGYWFHAKCEKLSEKNFRVLRQLSEGYICSSCTHTEGHFDYDKALLRLENSARNDMLSSGVKMEIILLRNTPVTQMKAEEILLGNQRVDTIARDMLKKTGTVDARLPVAVPGDGNCLFYSLSVAMIGELGLAKELKVRTCIEMVVNKEIYTKMHKHTGVALVSPDYPKAMKDCATAWAYSSAWTISAAATVMNTRIVSVYPPLNGLLDKTIRILHRTFVPLKEDKSRRSIFIMWTSASKPMSSAIWSPNHFVPLLLVEYPPVMTLSGETNSCLEAPVSNEAHSALMTSTPKRLVSCQETMESPPKLSLSPIDVSTYTKDNQSKDGSSEKTTLNAESVFPDEISPSFATFTKSSVMHFPPSIEITTTSNVHSTPSIEITTTSNVHSTPSIEITNTSNVHSTSSIEITNTSNVQYSPTFATSGKSKDHFPVSTKDKDRYNILGAISIENEKFSDPEHVLHLMLHESATGKTIPKGIKENVLFVLKDDDNTFRRANGKRAIYVDDCGAWSDKASCKTHHYIITEEERLQYVDKKEGQYVKYSKGKRVPLEPQPLNNIIVFKRYYITLRRDPSYKRRISTVSECPDNISHIKNIAIVEYLGKYPLHSMPHGNSKKVIGEYTRTSLSVKRKLIDMIDTKKNPRDIYEDMVLNSSNDAPRDLKQVQNTKQRRERNENERQKRQYRLNVADEVQILLSDIHTNPFVQEIIQTKGKPPSVILYLNENLEDIKQFCTTTANNPSVLGIDRTFNLGACYATSLVYQHNNLVRKGKSNPPIMLAAIYLHWDGLFTTYQRFFSHLQGKLSENIGGTQFSNLVIGSDEEAALTKAIKQCFPSAFHVLCTRHLQENVCRYLSNKIGANNEIRKDVVKDIFGNHGLASCDDIKKFEIKVIKLSEKYSKLLPAFNNYFETIVEKLRSGIINSRQKNKWIPIDWKNNSCESMNHIIKLSANWKKMKLPDLIERLHKIVKLQQIDCRRALHSQGNYELAPWMSKFKVQHAHWNQMNDEERDTIYKKFLRGRPRREKSVVSTDGRLTIPRTPATAKKPGQRKRIKNAKTKTCK